MPDSHFLLSTQCLSKLDYLSPCSDHISCPTSTSSRYTPSPEYHYHTGDSEVTVDIHIQSNTLWFLPALQDFLCDPKSEILPDYLLLASDDTVLPPWRPGRGAGVFKTKQPPVVVPRASTLLEAFLRIYARDCDTRIGNTFMIAYIELYVDNDGLLDLDKLPQPLRSRYEELREGDVDMAQWVAQLKESVDMRGSLHT